MRTMDSHATKQEISIHNEPNPEIRSLSILCQICKERQTKYTCPKCQMAYCSVECYQKHNNQCTEYFYKENVVEFLKSTKATDEEKQKMARVLKQMFEEEKNSLSPEVMNQLMELDLDDPNLFEKLPRDQQEDFKKAIRDGRLSNLIQLWEPWWKHCGKIQEIKVQKESSQHGERLEKRDDEEENDEESNDESDVPLTKTVVPPIIHPIPPLSSLTKSQPSPLVLHNIVEVLYHFRYSSISSCTNTNSHSFCMSFYATTLWVVSSHSLTVASFTFCLEE